MSADDVCELCGAVGPVSKYIIEGAQVYACASCGRFGRLVETPKPKIQSKSTYGSFKGKKNSSGFSNKTSTRKPSGRGRTYDLLLIEDYGNVIQKARKRLGLTRKDIAEKLFIREHLLKRIEDGKFRPDDSLIKKLEKLLEVSLLEKESDTESTVALQEKAPKNVTRSLTLGDFARIRKKKSK